MRWLPVVAVITGCTVDPCASFGGQTCIAVEVRGNLTLDQLFVTTSFGLHDAPSPPAPRDTPVSTPVALAVLAGSAEGDYKLTLRARLQGMDIATASGAGTLRPGATTQLVLDLTPGAPDLLFQPDLSRRVDLAGADLAGVECDVVSQQPCLAGQKCMFNPSTPQCQPDGPQAVAQPCVIAPLDNCARGTQCLFQGSLTDGICEQFCSSDSNCTQPAVNVGGTALPNNRAHCLFQFGGTGPVNLCSLACNPVSSQGPSGCPSGSGCIYGSNATFSEITFCDRAGTAGDGQPCNSSFRCAAGFNCVGVGSSFICRAMCRANTSGDCSAPLVCKPGAGGNPPMFGYCCPSTGC
jgi:hypothetical protein